MLKVGLKDNCGVVWSLYCVVGRLVTFIELGCLVTSVEIVMEGRLVTMNPVDGFVIDGHFVTKVEAVELTLLLFVNIVGLLVEEVAVVVTSEVNGPSTMTVGAGLELPWCVVTTSYEGPTMWCELVLPVEKPGFRVV